MCTHAHTHCDTGTPILGGYRRKETLNALEKIKNTVLNEERSGQMRTLGHRNEFVRGNGRSTLDTKSRRRAIVNGPENGMFSEPHHHAQDGHQEDSETMAPSAMQMQQFR